MIRFMWLELPLLLSLLLHPDQTDDMDDILETTYGNTMEPQVGSNTESNFLFRQTRVSDVNFHLTKNTWIWI